MNIHLVQKRDIFKFSGANFIILDCINSAEEQNQTCRFAIPRTLISHGFSLEERHSSQVTALKVPFYVKFLLTMYSNNNLALYGKIGIIWGL